MKATLFVLLTIAWAGCAAPAERAPAGVPAIWEAVFRYQFAHNSSAAQDRAEGYYLEIAQADPALDFLERFAGHAPPVLPGSRFAEGKGVLFRIDRVEWRDERRVRVEGGYYEANLSASGNEYELEWRDGRWVVVAARMLWIS